MAISVGTGVSALRNRTLPSDIATFTRQERFAVLTLAALIIGGGLFPQVGVASRYQAAQAVHPCWPNINRACS